MSFLTGSICLSDIPKEVIKKVTCKDGVTRYYVNIVVGDKKKPLLDDDGKIRSDHYISCQPRPDERKEGVNYFIGDMRLWVPTALSPTREEIENAPPADMEGPIDDLPF